MTYDNWKTTNPADAYLGPEPDEEPEQMAIRTVPITSHPITELCEMFRQSGQPRRSIRTASPAEIAQTKASIVLCFSLFQSAFEAYIRKLNENLEITSTIEYRDLLDGLADMKSDIVGRLEAAEDRGEAA